MPTWNPHKQDTNTTLLVSFRLIWMKLTTSVTKDLSMLFQNIFLTHTVTRDVNVCCHLVFHWLYSYIGFFFQLEKIRTLFSIHYTKEVIVHSSHFSQSFLFRKCALNFHQISPCVCVCIYILLYRSFNVNVWLHISLGYKLFFQYVLFAIFVLLIPYLHFIF